MALKPAKKEPKQEKPAQAPDSHLAPQGDQAQAPPPQPGLAREMFHLELDLHPEELALLKKLSEQFGKHLGSLTPRALVGPKATRAPLPVPPRPRKPQAAGRKVVSVRRKVARRR